MNMNEADTYRHWAAVYVLGSLTPGERREYETHLAECAQCSADVAEFAGLPELLDTLAPEEAQAIGRRSARRDLFGRLAAKFPRETRLLLAGLVMGLRAANCGSDANARSGRR
ncbi:zf-HC2 domain-containing protein [Pseudarthrobacter sp. MDT3-26]|uniref:zf-HC2 domain-containing protein n=1 Tax=Pseudarthrobacter raffinosi TaxID=2953651 RepID=UPI00208F4285|nr:zf-HC2 domain-containing protein [Pseudarthrobacter sp. MDT3-26]MCO4265219.1 zf-HC2 domain-containing protein [Pseudarthrobacter sp. MDT3-26]